MDEEGFAGCGFILVVVFNALIILGTLGFLGWVIVMLLRHFGVL